MWNILTQSILIILLSYPVVSALNNFVGFIIAKFIQRKKYTPLQNLNEKITILVPVKNEELVIEENIKYWCTRLLYDNYDVILINDNSTDNTSDIIKTSLKKYSNLKFLNLTSSYGKSKALNMAMNFVESEYVLVCDADTIMEEDALQRYLSYFIEDENVGAVSGNISIRNTNKMIEKSQVIEFSNLLSLVKRTQQHIFSRIFTLSGANAMYRTQALCDVGLFRNNRSTEDISITWDLQLKGWKTHFAPHILFFTSVPSSWRQLFKQRLRWAIGGFEVWTTNTLKVFKNPIKNIGLIAIWLDYLVTFIWTITFFILLILFTINASQLFFTHQYLELFYLFAYLFIFIHFQILLGFLEILLAVSIEKKRKKWRYLYFAPLYILFYWVINPITLIICVIPAIKNLINKEDVTWTSPKR